MRLVRLAVVGFRNLKPAVLETDRNFVVFYGENAQGKTNLLEAVYFLSTLKPLRGRRIRELVRWGEAEGAVAGWVRQSDELVVHHRVDIKGKSKTIKVQGQLTPVDRYFETIRAIRFMPDDARIITGEPSLRRNWIDRAAFTARPGHLKLVWTVRKILAQKASLLRKEMVDLDLLSVLNEQLVDHAVELVTRRLEILQELNPYLSDLHHGIAGGEWKIKLKYQTVIKGKTLSERRVSFRERLLEVRDREIERKTTLAGPQLDDLKFLIDGKSARTYGSRGQIRSVVLALKLAETVAAKERGQLPLFLIDDVSSELDRGRTERLVHLLCELGVQVWVTTTEPSHLGELPPERTCYFEVKDGQVEERSGEEG